MKNHSSVPKTIRFPIEVYNWLDTIAQDSGKSFSAVVIEQLMQGQSVTVVEGQTIARLLFEIKRIINETDYDCDIVQRITEVNDKIVDTLLEIYEKYIGGKKYGNHEGG